MDEFEQDLTHAFLTSSAPAEAEHLAEGALRRVRRRDRTRQIALLLSAMVGAGLSALAIIASGGLALVADLAAAGAPAMPPALIALVGLALLALAAGRNALRDF